MKVTQQSECQDVNSIRCARFVSQWLRLGALALLVFPAAGPAAQSIAVPNQLAVVDNNGRTMGRLLDPDTMAVAVDGEVAFIDVDTTDLYSAQGSGYLVFDQQDCQGTG